MRVEIVAVGEFDSILQMAKLGADRGRARHGCIHMQPKIVLLRDLGDLRDRIHRVRRCCADRGADQAGEQAGALVGFDLPGEIVGPHCKIFVHVDGAQIVDADACDHRSFLQ